MWKYFQNPAAENRTKQSKRSTITRSLVRLDQYVITYKYNKRKGIGKILLRMKTIDPNSFQLFFFDGILHVKTL
jgi:hypothetical protein